LVCLITGLEERYLH